MTAKGSHVARLGTPRPVAGQASDPSSELQDGKRTPQAIYSHLRDLILDGALPPDSAISQVALARKLGVSRTPLREAIRRLEQEGLVDAQHNRRARVISFDPDDLEAVYCNRLMFETLGIVVTVPRLVEEDIALIDELLDEMKRQAVLGDDAGYTRAHRGFHDALVMHAHPALQRQIAAFADRGNRYRRLYRFNVAGADESGAVEHHRIADACREQDAAAAAVALARHLSHTALSLLARMAPEREPTSLRAALLLVTGSSRRCSSQHRGWPPQARAERLA